MFNESWHIRELEQGCQLCVFVFLYFGGIIQKKIVWTKKDSIGVKNYFMVKSGSRVKIKPEFLFLISYVTEWNDSYQWRPPKWVSTFVNCNKAETILLWPVIAIQSTNLVNYNFGLISVHHFYGSWLISCHHGALQLLNFGAFWLLFSSIRWCENKTKQNTNNQTISR